MSPVASVAASEVLADVAVVVLNWRRYPDTAACLASLRLLPRRPHVYLVDHHSDPQALASMLEAFPEVIPLPQPDNPGFAEGMNRGMARALADGASYVLLLNNDARVTPPALERLRAVFETRADAGVVGAALHFPEPDGRVQSLGIDVNRATGRIRLRGYGARADYRPPDHRPPDLQPVDAVSGAAMMLSAGALEAVGRFDPGYFLYFEDVDLCLRARAGGFGVYLEPAAVVYHEGGATIGRSPKQIYYGVRNQLEVVHRHGLPLSRPLELARAGYVVGLNLGRLLLGAPVTRLNGLPRLLQGVRDYRAGRLGPHAGSPTDG